MADVKKHKTRAAVIMMLRMTDVKTVQHRVGTEPKQIKNNLRQLTVHNLSNIHRNDVHGKFTTNSRHEKLQSTLKLLSHGSDFCEKIGELGQLLLAIQLFRVFFFGHLRDGFFQR